MKTKSPTLMNEIFAVTRRIQVKFPELYHVLGETPLFLTETEKSITSTDFEKYLESLQNQMAAFEKAARQPLTS